MNRKNVTLGGAAAGALAGVVGLAVLAMPANAGTAPSLPAVTPDALVQSVMTAQHPAMAGTVEVKNGLGLPTIPGLPAPLTASDSSLRVWSDGGDKVRLAIPQGASEETIVNDGKVLWDWDSANRTVTKTDHSALKPGEGKPGAHPNGAPLTQPQDPASMAKEIIADLQKTSNVSVDGTSTVADRPAYDLVLTPKPQEKTLLREVRVSVDSATRIPVQVAVLANGSPDPALRVGFSKLDIGKQDPSLFTFTVPAGAIVRDKHPENAKPQAEQLARADKPQVVGQGWDAVVVGKMPAGQLTGAPTQQNGARKGGQDPMSLLKRIGTPVSGPWGQGYLISTKVGTALVTSDGRFAAGAVPQQVLTDAIGQVK